MVGSIVAATTQARPRWGFRDSSEEGVMKDVFEYSRERVLLLAARHIDRDRGAVMSERPYPGMCLAARRHTGRLCIELNQPTDVTAIVVITSHGRQYSQSRALRKQRSDLRVRFLAFFTPPSSLRVYFLRVRSLSQWRLHFVLAPKSCLSVCPATSVRAIFLRLVGAARVHRRGRG